MNNEKYSVRSSAAMADAPQVVEGGGHNAPQVVDEHYAYHLSEGGQKEAYPSYDSHQGAQRQPAMILGLRRRNFWILVGVLLVVVAATVGGSVGGTLAVQRNL